MIMSKKIQKVQLIKIVPLRQVSMLNFQQFAHTTHPVDGSDKETWGRFPDSCVRFNRE